ncbi:MAG: DUF305 domain-containing protein [Actinomycetospora chiangmaiensis]|nr:DUF305 domain-containing protein [Actinomycetospora chiangmaiensis]
MRQLGLALALGLTVAAGAAAAQHLSHAPSGHAHGSGPTGTDTPATREFKAAHGAMMRAMDVPYTGDPDVDFRIQMIPHHQGAIAMARVALARATDPWTRQLAEAVIVEQQREIAEMAAWLTRRGVTPPRVDEPSHILQADSFRSQTPEAGTRGEMRGQSWAPGAGIR